MLPSKMGRPVNGAAYMLANMERIIQTPNAPIMQPSDWRLPFEIMCDASDYAICTVLGQRKDKKLHAIYYASRTLDSAQINYAITEKELLAVVIGGNRTDCF